MFNEISVLMKRRMKELETIDEKDRRDGTERLKRLRQIPAETGKFLSLYAANLRDDGDWIEVGTSAGYSTMWLSLAAKEAGKRIKTFEILDDKVQLAKETIQVTGIHEYVELIHGDFLKQADDIGNEDSYYARLGLRRKKNAHATDAQQRQPKIYSASLRKLRASGANVMCNNFILNSLFKNY